MMAANGNSVEINRVIEETQDIQKDEEISLDDIVSFFIHKSKFLALTTIGLSIIGIFLALVQPKQYQKQLVLSIKPIQLPLVEELPGIDLTIDRAGSIAVDFLKQQPLEGIAIQSQYDNITQKVDLTLRSPNSDSLAKATPEVLKQLKTDWQVPLKETVSTNLIVLEGELSRHQAVLSQIEQQIAQSSSPNSPRLEALETQRAAMIVNISALNADQKYLKNAQDNLSNFANKALAIEILQESAVQSSRSPSRIVIMAVTASFLIALFAALVRDRFSAHKQ